MARYAFLGTGVLYGMANQSRLEVSEVKVREIEARKKEQRDIKLSAERKRAVDAEKKAIDDLSKPTKK